MDYIRRSLITSGELKRTIDENEIWGVTSNPSIFQKAIAGSSDYDAALKSLEQERDRDVMSLYEALAIEDIQTTADCLEPDELAPPYYAFEEAGATLTLVSLKGRPSPESCSRCWRQCLSPRILKCDHRSDGFEPTYGVNAFLIRDSIVRGAKFYAKNIDI